MKAELKLLPVSTRKSIKDYLVGFQASTTRAQLINIIGYRLADDESIADRFIRDHVSVDHAYRQALLLVDAGAAKLDKVVKKVHCGNGVFKDKEVACNIVFEDGSRI